MQIVNFKNKILKDLSNEDEYSEDNRMAWNILFEITLAMKSSRIKQIHSQAKRIQLKEKFQELETSIIEQSQKKMLDKNKNMKDFENVQNKCIEMIAICFRIYNGEI